jgi:hypothetical protein
MDVIREPHPDVHAAAGADPGDAGEGGEFAVDGIEHGVAFAAVAGDDALDMLAIGPIAEDVGKDVLVEVGGAEVFVAFEVRDGFDECFREDAESDADAWGEAFGKGLGEDYGFAGFVERPDAGGGGAVVAEFAVGGIFEEEDAGRFGIVLSKLQELWAAFCRDAYAAGVFKVTHEVDQSDAGE